MFTNIRKIIVSFTCLVISIAVLSLAFQSTSTAPETLPNLDLDKPDQQVTTIIVPDQVPRGLEIVWEAFSIINHDFIDKHLIDKVINSPIGKNCISFENLTIGETLPIIKNCDAYCGNDTGFLHLSCALGLKCIAIFFNSPVLSYGTYAENITCVIPKGETMESTVHDLALGRERISVEDVYNKVRQILNL